MSTEQECTTRTIHGDNEKRNVQETRLSGSWCSSYEYRKYKLSVKPFRSPYYGRFSARIDPRHKPFIGRTVQQG